MPPSVPVLLQIMSGAQDAKDLLPAESMLVLPRNATIQLSFPLPTQLPGTPHPIHMHGVSIILLRMLHND